MAAVIGPPSSSDVRAVNPVCSGLHVPQVAPLATDPTFNPLDNPYLVRVRRHRPQLVLSALNLKLTTLDQSHRSISGSVSLFVVMASSSSRIWDSFLLLELKRTLVAVVSVFALGLRSDVLQMSAPDNMQSQALADLVRLYGWTRLAILADNSVYGLFLFLRIIPCFCSCMFEMSRSTTLHVVVGRTERVNGFPGDSVAERLGGDRVGDVHSDGRAARCERRAAAAQDQGRRSGAQTNILCSDLHLVPERVPGTAKHIRHRGQDSVDKSFSNKIVFNSVNSWCADFFWFKHDAAERILFKVESTQLWNFGL